MNADIFKKVDLLLQYTLAVAAEEDDFESRSLGPIHLIKYVYLADLAYAQLNNGITYTGIKWKFHHFGPWSLEVFNRIEPALYGIQAEKQIIASKYEDDTIRWKLNNDYSIGILHKQINSPLIAHTIKAAVHQFGSDTVSLLKHVYLTKPMLCAAPEDYLDFTQAILPRLDKLEEKQYPVSFTAKQLKKMKKKDDELRSEIQAKLEQRKQKDKITKYKPSPRYDDVFIEGQRWLDSLAGDELSELNGEATFSADIWKSKTRFDPDVS